MGSVAKWQDDHAWAQGEVYTWLWSSLGIREPGPEDAGTAEMLNAITGSIEAADGDDERLGALFSELTLAGRALLHALAQETGETPQETLARLLPGPPRPGFTIGGGRY